MPESAARKLLDLSLIPFDRMAGEIEAKALLLEGETLALRPARNIRESASAPRRRHGRQTVIHQAEEIRLPGFTIRAQAGGAVQRGLKLGKEDVATRIDRIERTALDETLHRALVRRLHVDTRSEIVERCEWTFLPRHHHRLGRALAHVLHRGQREPNRAVLDREVGKRRVHVGRQDRQAEIPRLRAVRHQLVGVRLFHGEQ